MDSFDDELELAIIDHATALDADVESQLLILFDTFMLELRVEARERDADNNLVIVGLRGAGQETAMPRSFRVLERVIRESKARRLAIAAP